MVAVREIPRTATFTWSPEPRGQYIATGTKAGAVDEGFSNDTQLEVWDLLPDRARSPDDPQPLASISTDSRFNDIAWTKEKSVHGNGVVAGGLENGSLDLWDADKLIRQNANPFISRTMKHSGSIKALQFNSFRSELLATVGVKGELFISDINNAGSPFRMGNAVARADDFECLDWNKRTSHIMVTGSSGGIITVWDIKNKRESLTLNNIGRKLVSAVAWDPFKTTRLVTAVPSDSDPVILVWDLRNANAPERTLQGHDGGVLSLSWCQQDGDLLLSCGKDNRNICWNPQTGESSGEFPVVTNWTFQTRFNPQNPHLIATASFDGKILVNSIQDTQTNDETPATAPRQQADDEDFFNKAQTRAQGTKFSLKKAPRWLRRPCGASFAFGGKVASFKISATEPTRQSVVRISTFAIDDSLVSATESFETSLKHGDYASICESNIKRLSGLSDTVDWRIMKLLMSEDRRKSFVEFLGMAQEPPASHQGDDTSPRGSQSDDATATKKDGAAAKSRLSTFFDEDVDTDSFPSDLAANKNARASNPFRLYTGSESASNKNITQSLLLGKFDHALEVCISEDRMADAFMIATCGGQACIKRAQEAYLSQKDPSPNYLRLLAAVANKNLWDLVYNTNLSNWKEIMVAVCTYASPNEFSDLCEVLGDRLTELDLNEDTSHVSRDDATLCYMAGTKLQKVVDIWLSDLREKERSSLREDQVVSRFSLHARLLQDFIEKVTVFREVTTYKDEQLDRSSNWNLVALYEKYIEYADIAAAHGQLQIAKRFLDLLPSQYAAADVAKGRIMRATQKSSESPLHRQAPSIGRAAPKLPTAAHASSLEQSQPGPMAATAQSRQYSSSTAPRNPYAPVNGLASTGAYTGLSTHPTHQQIPPSGMAYGSQLQGGSSGAPPRGMGPSPTVPPPSKASNMGNWNDMPESFFKPPSVSRRGTPSSTANNSSFQAHPNIGQNLPVEPPPRASPSIGPPPKAGLISAKSDPPTFGGSDLASGPERPTSVTNPYAPPTNSFPAPTPSLVARGPSPYNAPPAGPPVSNRYAPAQPASSPHVESSTVPPNGRQQGPPPNPYAPKQSSSQPPSGPPPRQQIKSPLTNPLRNPPASQTAAGSLTQEYSNPVSRTPAMSPRNRHREYGSLVLNIHR